MHSNPHVHDERRAKGKERKDLGDEAVGVPDDRQNDHRTGNERQHEEHVQLLQFLLGAGHCSQSGGDAGVENVPKKKKRMKKPICVGVMDKVMPAAEEAKLR